MGFAIGTSGADFRSRMNLVSERVKGQVERKIAAYGVTLIKALVQNTPVLTGQARANWQASLSGSPGASLIGPGGYTTDPRQLAHGPPASVPFGTYEEAAIATAQSYRAGQVLTIFSNLPYIEQLNSGYSRQAPAGFVETAIMQARATFRSAL